MASRISNLELLGKCRQFILVDPTRESVDELIKTALITSNREIFKLDTVPLAWARGTYDNLYTRSYATVDDISQANPGVLEATSVDDDITGHGFTDKDLIYITGLTDDSMDELNERLFRLNYVDADTFSLLNLDGQHAVNTLSLDAYSSGGTVYQAGIYIPSSTIEPSSGDLRWKIADIYGVDFDLNPALPISEEAVINDKTWNSPGSRPTRWRYWRNDYTDFNPDNTEHFILFYQFPSQRYNVRIHYEKGYPDLSVWTNAAYPPHPPEVHDYIWHRALAILTGNSEKMKRQSTDGRNLMGMIEVQYERHWMMQKALDEARILELSRSLLGSKHTSSSGGWRA